MLSQIAVNSANIAIPESEKEYFWVKCGLLKKSCRQIRAPCTSISAIITSSRLMMNFSLEVTGPRTMRDFSWNTWEKQDNSCTTQTITRLYHIGHDRNFKKMLASTETSLQRAKQQDVSYVMAAPRWRLLQLSLLLVKDCYSARQASISLPLFYPLPKSPSNKRTSRWSGASAPPMIIASQKQINPCPILKPAATLVSTEFMK